MLRDAGSSVVWLAAPPTGRLLPITDADGAGRLCQILVPDSRWGSGSPSRGALTAIGPVEVPGRPREGPRVAASRRVAGTQRGKPDDSALLFLRPPITADAFSSVRLVPRHSNLDDSGSGKPPPRPPAPPGDGGEQLRAHDGIPGPWRASYPAERATLSAQNPGSSRPTVDLSGALDPQSRRAAAVVRLWAGGTRKPGYFFPLGAPGRRGTGISSHAPALPTASRRRGPRSPKLRAGRHRCRRCCAVRSRSRSPARLVRIGTGRPAVPSHSSGSVSASRGTKRHRGTTSGRRWTNTRYRGSTSQRAPALVASGSRRPALNVVRTANVDKLSPSPGGGSARLVGGAPSSCEICRPRQGNRADDAGWWLSPPASPEACLSSPGPSRKRRR